MQETLKKFNKLVNDLLQDESKQAVSNYIPTNELYDKLDLSLSKEGIPEEVFEKALQELVLATPKTATNGFFNQLFGGRNQKAVLGDLLAVMLNNSMYTYKAAGPQIGVEKTVLREICNLVGWDKSSDGTFAPGGSMTNYMAMLMARDVKNPSIRKEGVKELLTVYTSNESHYSIPKNAAFSGIGRDQVRYIPSDDMGRMDLSKLEELIQEDIRQGMKPTLLNLTAGTTVLGAFDSIGPAAELAKKYNIWLHVDGAYCGSVIFSEKYRDLIQGIEKADSFSLNAHKMMGTPLTCSILVVKDKKHLYDSFSNDADYLYQTDQDDFNLGKTSLQCGRRNDALKFWTLWKSVGTNGLAKLVDHQFYLAEVARDYIQSNPDYTLYSFDRSISVCFNYKGISARAICTALYEEAELLVGYGSFNQTEFIRLVTINAQNSEDDILAFFHKLEQFVEVNQDLFLSEAKS